jgi:hypothetical protein
VIGNEGGLLEQPAHGASEFTIGPGESWGRSMPSAVYEIDRGANAFLASPSGSAPRGTVLRGRDSCGEQQHGARDQFGGAQHRDGRSSQIRDGVRTTVAAATLG